MKKAALSLLIAFLICLPLVAKAGQNGRQAQERDTTGKMSGKLASISGKVGSDGKILTADKDGKIWMVSNPEALSGINGLHVRLRARVDAALRQIQIVSVSAIAENWAGTKFGDAAFRK